MRLATVPRLEQLLAHLVQTLQHLSMLREHKTQQMVLLLYLEVTQVCFL